MAYVTIYFAWLQTFEYFVGKLTKLPRDDVTALLYNSQIDVPTDHNQPITSIDRMNVATNALGSMKYSLGDSLTLSVMKHHDALVEVHVRHNRIHVQTRLFAKVTTINKREIQLAEELSKQAYQVD